MKCAMFWFFAIFSILAIYIHPELWALALGVVAGIAATWFVFWGSNEAEEFPYEKYDTDYYDR